MPISGAGISVHSVGRSVVPSRGRLGLSFRRRLAAGKILAFCFLPLGRKTASEVLPFGDLAFGGLPLGVFGGLAFGDLAFGGLPLGVLGGLAFGDLAFGGLAFGRLPFGGVSVIPGLDRKSPR